MYTNGSLYIMSKFSSFKESKMLFENWRSHISEVSRPLANVMNTIANLPDEDQEALKQAVGTDDEAAMQEQQIDTNLSPEEKTQKMLEILRSMNDDDSECFDKALRALSEFTGKQGAP